KHGSYCKRCEDNSLRTSSIATKIPGGVINRSGAVVYPIIHYRPVFLTIYV
ncbi:hypothetical protein MRX96_052847, partial [Rhipicephalus microplus]